MLNPQWLFAPCVVLFNTLRHAINLEALKNYAKLNNLPIICWRNPLHGSAAAALNSAETNRLFSTHPALSGFFCPGAPAYGKTNVNPAKGIFNGSALIERKGKSALLLQCCLYKKYKKAFDKDPKSTSVKMQNSDF